MLYPNTNVIKRDSFVIISKNEEPHYLVLKMKNAMKMLLNSLDFGYTSKKRKEHHFLGLKIKKSNKKMAKTLGFWVYLQKKKNTIFWVSRLRRAIRK